MKEKTIVKIGNKIDSYCQRKTNELEKESAHTHESEFSKWLDQFITIKSVKSVAWFIQIMYFYILPVMIWVAQIIRHRNFGLTITCIIFIYFLIVEKLEEIIHKDVLIYHNYLVLNIHMFKEGTKVVNADIILTNIQIFAFLFAEVTTIEQIAGNYYGELLNSFIAASVIVIMGRESTRLIKIHYNFIANNPRYYK